MIQFDKIQNRRGQAATPALLRLMRIWLALAALLLLRGEFVLAEDQVAPRVDLYGDKLPAGAMVRLGSNRFRGGSYQMSPLFGAGDEAFVTIAGNHRLVVIEASSGMMIREMKYENYNITAGRLSANRQFLFTLGHEYDEERRENFQTIRRWNLAIGELDNTIRFESRAYCEKFALTPDEKYLITAGSDGSIQIWNVETTEIFAEHSFGRRRIDAMTLSPDGKMLSIAVGAELHLWKWLEQAEPESIECESNIQSLAFSADGRRLAVGPVSHAAVIVRNTSTGEIVQRLSIDGKQQMFVNDLAFTADGKQLIAANGLGKRGIPYRIHVWNVATGRMEQQFATGELEPYRIGVSGNGRWLAACGPTSSMVWVWDLKTEELMGRNQPGHSAPVTSVQFLKNGRQAVSASDDGTVCVWDVATMRGIRQLDAGYLVKAIAISQDDKWIAASTLTDAVPIWDASTGLEIKKLPGHGDRGGVRAVAWNSDHKQCLSWGDDFQLRRFDVTTGKILFEYRVHPPELKLPNADNKDEFSRGIDWLRNSVDQAEFSADGKRLLLGRPASISLFDTEKGELISSNEHLDGSLVSLAISPDASLFATSSWGKPIDIMMADGRFRTTAQKNHKARVRDAVTGETKLEISIPDGGAGPVAFSPDGRFVAIASTSLEASIQIFELKSGQQKRVIPDIPDGATVLKYSADNGSLACGFRDGTVLIWRVQAPYSAHEVIEQKITGFATVELAVAEVRELNIDSVPNPDLASIQLLCSHVANSEAEAEFCIIISRDVATRLKQLGIDDFSRHFRERTVRVLGEVEYLEPNSNRSKGIYRQHVTSLDQMERVTLPSSHSKK